MVVADDSVDPLNVSHEKVQGSEERKEASDEPVRSLSDEDTEEKPPADKWWLSGIEQAQNQIEEEEEPEIYM